MNRPTNLVNPARPTHWAVVAAAVCAFCCAQTARAVTTIFFNSSQMTNLVATNTTSDTISSEGYLFTFTRDKLFTGGYGLTNPIGRTVGVSWPNGLAAQAVTTGPVTSGARIILTRQDGQPFALAAFTARLFANTSPPGGAIEIMPLLNGEDGVPNPFMYDATGYYGQNFTNHTPELTGFDTYKITLWVDFALMSLTVVDASLPPPPPPTLQISLVSANAVQLDWPTNSAGFTLQQNSDLGSTNWVTYAGTITVVDTNYQATISTQTGSGFFRLNHP